MGKLNQTAVHLINLDKDSDRLAHMDASLSKLGLPYSRFPAVKGSNLTPEQAADAEEMALAHLSPAEAGCLLSHLTIWEKVAESDTPLALILEDDLHFAPGFGELVAYLDRHVDEAANEIHRFETFFARVTLARQSCYAFDGRQGFHMHSNHAGAAAYLLSRKTARTLLSCKGSLRHLPDTEMFDPERRAANGFKVVQWLPAPCVQDMLIPSNKGLQSNLASARYDDRAGITRHDKGFARALKKVLRPAYTRMYSLLLSARGRMRRHIRFG